MSILEVNKDRLLQCVDDGEAMTMLGIYFDRVISRDASHILDKPARQNSSSNGAADVVQSIVDYLVISDLFFTT